jgi:hypothetical protein
LTGFIKVLANKSIPPFLKIVKTLLFVPHENADLSKDSHIVISVDTDENDSLAPGEFILFYVNPDDISMTLPDNSTKIVDVTNKVDQMELIISFLIRHQDYVMTSRAMVPFDLILVNKVGGEINVGPTSIKLLWNSLSVGFQSFKFAVRHNFLGVPSAVSDVSGRTN